MKILSEFPELRTALHTANQRHKRLRETFKGFALQAERLPSSGLVSDIEVMPLDDDHFNTKFLDRELTFTFSSKLSESGILVGVIGCYLRRARDESSIKVDELIF